jgi:hypothetical protein
VLRRVVDVEHRGLDIRVTHVGPDVRQRERLNRERPERVAQVMEDERLARPPVASDAGLFIAS